MIDAPCTGTGAWRRNPDAKWRLRPNALAMRVAEQDAVLREGAALVKPGGRLVYITCSVLPDENEGRLAAFRSAYPSFAPISAAEAAVAANLPALSGHAAASGNGVLLTPRTAGTDGFFIAVMRRTA